MRRLNHTHFFHTPLPPHHHYSCKAFYHFINHILPSFLPFFAFLFRVLLLLCLLILQVGGALAHTPGSPSSSSSDSDSLSSAAWDDCSQGLCRDVQALQADPFTPSKLYAVAGSGSLPGGLYRCRGKGQKWRRLFGYRCVQQQKQCRCYVAGLQGFCWICGW